MRNITKINESVRMNLECNKNSENNEEKRFSEEISEGKTKIGPKKTLDMKNIK